MQCSKCKREITDNSIYCNWCGKKQIAEDKTDIAVPEPRKLPSDKWFIQLRLEGQSVSITESTAARCRTRAKAIKAGMIERRRSGVRMTLREAIDKYIKDNSALLSPSTIRGYQTIKRSRFKALMSVNIQTIDENMLKKAVKNEIPLCSPKTLKNAYGLVSTVIHEYTGSRYNVRLPDIIRNERPYLTPSQIPVFLEAIKDTDIEIPCLLGLWSCRCSEIYGLSWNNIDLNKRLIYIRDAVVKNENNEWVKKPKPKNLSSIRKIPIINRLHLLLSQNVGQTIVPMSQQTLRMKINKVCAANDLPLISIHGLRHSFASLGYYLNIPQKILMEIGGWANDKTMLNIYTHIAQDDVNHYSSELSDFFNQLYKVQ